MSAVWELDLPRDQKLVLMAFADHANDEGYTYPSLARVAWKCGYAQKRTVSDIVKRLLESGILSMIERAHGRTPTLYQIRTRSGKSLPPFDPTAFRSGDRGAENAPNADQSVSNPLNKKGEFRASADRGAESAPQFRRGSKNAPQQRELGVRSEAVGVRFPADRGAVASAPEPLNHIEPSRAHARARGAPGCSPGPSLKEHDPELRVLNNSARLLGIEPKTALETLQEFRRRIDTAHRRRLDAALAERKTMAGAEEPSR